MDWRAPLRLKLDGSALTYNWRWLAAQSGAAKCGAAIKADAYGLGAREVMARLVQAGCRDFFVATWGEAHALGALPQGVGLAVLHGVRADDMAVALTSQARPVLNTAEQIQRWKPTGRPCDVMVDTGINRLGIGAEDIAAGLLDGLGIDTLMSHLACGDEDSPMNMAQRTAFAALAGKTSARRMSLANSAGICLGPDYCFDLTRPGLAIYGGVPRAEADGHITQVVSPQAQVLQRRKALAGQTIGYGGAFSVEADTEVAIINIGYADGYLRAFSGPDGVVAGSAEEGSCPVVGRVSMDLVALDVSLRPDIGEGDWLTLDYNLPRMAMRSGLSQYELLTLLGARFERQWV